MNSVLELNNQTKFQDTTWLDKLPMFVFPGVKMS